MLQQRQTGYAKHLVVQTVHFLAVHCGEFQQEPESTYCMPKCLVGEV